MAHHGDSCHIVCVTDGVPVSTKSSLPQSSSPGRASCSSGKSNRSAKDGQSPTPAISSPLSKTSVRSSSATDRDRAERDRKKSSDGENGINSFSHHTASGEKRSEAADSSKDKKRSQSTSSSSKPAKGGDGVETVSSKAFSESPSGSGSVHGSLLSAHAMDMLSKDDLPTYLSSSAAAAAASTFPFPFPVFPTTLPGYPGMSPFPFAGSAADPTAALFANPLLSSAFSSMFPPSSLVDGFAAFGLPASLGGQTTDDATSSRSSSATKNASRSTMKHRAEENGGRERSVERDAKRENSVESRPERSGNTSAGRGKEANHVAGESSHRRDNKDKELRKSRSTAEFVKSSTHTGKESHTSSGNNKSVKVEGDPSGSTSVIRSTRAPPSPPPTSAGLNWQEAYMNLVSV